MTADGLGWLLLDAVALCIQIEDICPAFGCHVALTGGVLYKGGVRKDLDLVFYRIRQVESIAVDELFAALSARLGITTSTPLLRFCVKASRAGRGIDFFFPEVERGDYEVAPASAVAPSSDTDEVVF